MKARKNKLQVRLFKVICLVFLLQFNLLPSLAGNYDFNPFGLKPNFGQPAQPIQFKKDQTLEELLPRWDSNSKFLQPIPLNGVKIGGLNSKAIGFLGFNYFVVVDNTKFESMAELYRDNRLKGKCNFVTADSIIHPYFAFTNRVLATVIETHIAPDLSSLLKAMMFVAIRDYRQADDAEVRNDIEHNIAFLCVALKLLEPTCTVSVPEAAADMASADLSAVKSATYTRSAVLESSEDFASFRPIGWYNSSPTLQNFYRCREWIARLAYPISDISFGSEGNRGNNFRRAILLYRSIDTGTINDHPAFDTWRRLNQAWSLLGSPIASLQEGMLLPEQFKSVLKIAPSDLKVTLSSLAEPLFRTKLLLEIRKKENPGLSSTSVFDLDESGHSNDSPASFRLLPLAGDPELPWMRVISKISAQNSGSPNSLPVSLLVLHAWGAGQSNNILLDNINTLNPDLVKYLPILDHCITHRNANGQMEPVDDRRWNILSGYFPSFASGAQQVLQTDGWVSRHMESAFGAWVDSHLAIAPLNPQPSSPKPDAGTTDLSPARPVRPVFFHYLEPTPEIYRRMGGDAQKLSDSLTNLGYFPDRYKVRFADFIRLAKRLENISNLELAGKSLSLLDFKLLSTIDVLLDKVSVPQAGLLSLVSADSSKSLAGVNFCLGHPGEVYIILQSGGKTMLGRGGVYTYFEIPGPPITAEHWQRKLDFDLIHPPEWTEKFDIVQEEQTHRQSASSRQGGL